ncbi:hypothetical protein P4N68_06505 [Corynebacterium felinum]|uniref:Secreted protein n=1 Tax=Corynebacterium felinum TaxID=131318 RepID=A0ABU2B6H7_9CORY|nr:hypothetical protein [Corynebacterium felinum]MDF5820731.1 hypothetical protein [Corynebacterium felinum]MDR7354222.1 hypothetical protein [Corynebacterium felinum]
MSKVRLGAIALAAAFSVAVSPMAVAQDAAPADQTPQTAPAQSGAESKSPVDVLSSVLSNKDVQNLINDQRADAFAKEWGSAGKTALSAARNPGAAIAVTVLTALVGIGSTVGIIGGAIAGLVNLIKKTFRLP